MVNRRPSPQQLAALKYEIARKYRRKAGKAINRNRSRGMAAIRLSELTRWLDDSYGQGVELEANDASYAIVRIVAHHLGALADAPARIRSWIAAYSPWISPRDIERLIREVTECPLKWSADKLAWKLRLTDAKRSELKIRTIGAIDCNRDQRAKRRNKLKAERERKRRAAKRVSSI
jgi:hypothetical protein